MAGNGTAGYSGDAGAATSAELNDPAGVAVDAFSNIYVADHTNNRLRLVARNTPVYVSCSPNPAPFGYGTTCVASVEGVGTTGTVEWEYNSTVWQTDTLSGNTDSISGLSGNAAGTYTISAIYSGDSSQPAGTGTTSFVISQGTPGYSYLGSWQPPTIFQSNYYVSNTATFSAPNFAQITTVQWQLEWTPNYGIPTGTTMTICNGSGLCRTFPNVTVDGNTSFFAGESPNQTFTFEFEIPASSTIVYNPAYYGYSSNSWVEANYNY